MIKSGSNTEFGSYFIGHITRMVILVIATLAFSCNSDKTSTPERIDLIKDINIDWADKSDLKSCDVMYVQLNFNPFLDEKIAGKGIEELMYKDSLYSLNRTDKVRLLNIIGDSSNFRRGECGTFALNAGFLFTKNDTIKGIISLGCGYIQWGFEPWNQISQSGSLSDTGLDKMTKMLDEINLKMINGRTTPVLRYAGRCRTRSLVLLIDPCNELTLSAAPVLEAAPE